MKNNSISAVIIDDSDEEIILSPVSEKTKRVIKKQEPLKKYHLEDQTIF